MGQKCKVRPEHPVLLEEKSTVTYLGSTNVWWSVFHFSMIWVAKIIKTKTKRRKLYPHQKNVRKFFCFSLFFEKQCYMCLHSLLIKMTGYSPEPLPNGHFVPVNSRRVWIFCTVWWKHLYVHFYLNNSLSHYIEGKIKI